MAKEKIVILSNVGVCAIYFKGNRYLPGDEIEIAENDLTNQGIEMLIHRGDLVIKNDVDATDEVIKRAEGKRKKDPNEGKSRKELEDGGEF